MGHYHLKEHLIKMGLTNSPICERCPEKDESATHILCDREAMAYIRFCYLGHYFVEPGEYQEAKWTVWFQQLQYQGKKFESLSYVIKDQYDT
jgi:hypothetical protein